MSHITLLEKITTDVEAEVSVIQRESQANVDAITQTTEARVVELRSRYAAQLEKDLAHMELVAIAKAKQAGKLAVQTAKRSALDAIFTTATTQICTQAKESYVRFFGAHLMRMVPQGVQATHAYAPPHRLDETTELLEVQHLACTIHPDDQITAGVLLHTSDGVYDVTLERIMKEARASLEMEIVRRVIS